jgi:hypothetical protein
MRALIINDLQTNALEIHTFFNRLLSPKPTVRNSLSRLCGTEGSNAFYNPRAGKNFPRRGFSAKNAGCSRVTY